MGLSFVKIFLSYGSSVDFSVCIYTNLRHQKKDQDLLKLSIRNSKINDLEFFFLDYVYKSMIDLPFLS